MRAVVTSLAALLAVPVVAAVPAQAAPPTAAGGPGTLSHFDLARKDCVGTARNGTSKVWFTVGERRAVRRLRADHRQHQRRDAAVRGDRRVDVHRPADPGHDVHGLRARPDRDVLPGHQHPAPRRLHAGHRLPDRPAAGRRGDADPAAGRRLGSRSTCVTTPPSTATAAAARSTAAPTTRPSTRPPPPWSARTPPRSPTRSTGTTPCRCSAPSGPTGRSSAATSGYAGTPSDGLTQLDADHALGPITPDAPHGQRRADRPARPARQLPDHPGARLRADRRRPRSAPPAPRPGRRSTAPWPRYAAGWIALRRAAEAPAAATGRPDHRADLRLAQQY